MFFISDIKSLQFSLRHSSENKNIPNACYEGPSSTTKHVDYEIPVTRHQVGNVYDELPPEDIGASSRSYIDVL